MYSLFPIWCWFKWKVSGYCYRLKQWFWFYLCLNPFFAGMIDLVQQNFKAFYAIRLISVSQMYLIRLMSSPLFLIACCISRVVFKIYSENRLNNNKLSVSNKSFWLCIYCYCDSYILVCSKLWCAVLYRKCFDSLHFWSNRFSALKASLKPNWRS